MCKHFDIKCFRVRYIVKPSVSNGSITNNGLNKIENSMSYIRKVISGKFSWFFCCTLIKIAFATNTKTFKVKYKFL